jgi:hypothetical protein
MNAFLGEIGGRLAVRSLLLNEITSCENLSNLEFIDLTM